MKRITTYFVSKYISMRVKGFSLMKELITILYCL